MRWAWVIILLCCAVGMGHTCRTAAAEEAAAFYVAPDGKPDNEGTRASPWDIASALGGQKKIPPGATIYLAGGTYRRRPEALFRVTLTGTPEQPIHIRPLPGQRATIDGGLLVVGTSYVWFWDLEITVSEPNPVDPVRQGSHPAGFRRPWGGVHSGNAAFDFKGCKFINLVVHHCRQGFSLWVGATDSEVYGCIIYDNGWWATDRGHGHAIYTQNKDGIKRIADCIMTGGHSYTMHAYGSARAYVDNFLIEGNIAYDAGAFLVGGGRPSRNCKVLDNTLYRVFLRMGYSARENFDCEVRGNVVARERLHIRNYRSGLLKDNLILGGKRVVENCKGLVQDGNQIIPDDALVRRPARVVLRPNKYDPRRANLAIFNWPRRLVVQVDAAGFLKDGERYVLKDPKHFFGDPVHWGACEKGRIAVPMFGKEFAAFVVLRED